MHGFYVHVTKAIFLSCLHFSVFADSAWQNESSRLQCLKNCFVFLTITKSCQSSSRILKSEKVNFPFFWVLLLKSANEDIDECRREGSTRSFFFIGSTRLLFVLSLLSNRSVIDDWKGSWSLKKPKSVKLSRLDKLSRSRSTTLTVGGCSRGPVFVSTFDAKISKLALIDLKWRQRKCILLTKILRRQ